MRCGQPRGTRVEFFSQSAPVCNAGTTQWFSTRYSTAVRPSRERVVGVDMLRRAHRASTCPQPYYYY